MSRRMLCSILCFACGASGMAAADAPAWLRQLSVAAPAEELKSAQAVVLLDERSVRVGADGHWVTESRRAVRIQSRQAADEALARQVYNTDSQKVGDLNAWLILPSGEVKKYGKKETIDVALVNNDIYNEARVKFISAEDDVVPGSVFGYEAVLDARSVFTQYEWQFQGRLPTSVSRFRLSLPQGWEESHVLFNHDPIEPQGGGSDWMWELTGLPEIAYEPMSPPLSSLAPRLAVSFFPSRDSGLQSSAFSEWSAVSRWLTRLNQSSAVADAALTSQAQSLTAGSAGEWEKIQAIGRYVQGVQYVSIQTGIGRGGGYTPRPAPEVFSKRYGDCKDKANLMRTMLEAVGITSFPVAIFSGDPNYVRKEWPSPQQFNHAIVAIQVSGEKAAPAMIEYPGLGHLLFFDPTDDVTSLGALRDDLQGTFALLIAGEQGGLIETPSASPEGNALTRKIEASLQLDGSIKARIVEESRGQAALEERGLLRSASMDDYVRMIEGWVTRGVTGARVLKAEVSEGQEDPFVLQVQLEAPSYGQLMQGRLLIFKPALVSRRNSLALTGGERHHPVSLSARIYSEETTFKLPVGFSVDERPDPVSLDLPFGIYRAGCREDTENRTLICERSMTLKRSIVPAEHYESVRDFFAQIRDFEQTPVVLMRR